MLCPVSHSLHPKPCIPAPQRLQLLSHSLHPKPCCVHPACFVLHRAPLSCTFHLALCTLTPNSAPRTLHPTCPALQPAIAPCKLYPRPSCNPYLEPPCTPHSLNPHTLKPTCVHWAPCACTPPPSNPYPAHPIPGAHLPPPAPCSCPPIALFSRCRGCWRGQLGRWDVPGTLRLHRVTAGCISWGQAPVPPCLLYPAPHHSWPGPCPGTWECGATPRV